MISENRVHREIKERLTRIGWEKLPSELVREHELLDNYLVEEVFNRKFLELNRDKLKSLKDEDVKEILTEVKSKLLNTDDPAKVLEFLKWGITVSIKQGPLGKTQIRIKLIDYEVLENNAFHYGHEIKFKGKPDNSKPDFTLFINGIPVVIIEAKRKFSVEHTVDKALKDIRDYEIKSPKLFNFVQFAVAYGDEKGYVPTLPNWEGIERPLKPEIWRDEEKKENVYDLLRPDRLTEILRSFIFIHVDKAGNLRRIVPRYMQYFAVKKAFRRVQEYINGISTKRKGLVWHWQGSGKTFEILFLTEFFFEKFESRNPHVFIVVDRQELEDQMEKDLNVKPARFRDFLKRIQSVEELKKELKKIKEQEENPTLTFKGVYLVMVHKFRKDVHEELKDIGPITKKEILVLRDEAHRTEYGILADVREAVLKEALKFGFTGTPVHRRDRNTFKEFSEEGEFYLDRYFIEDSLRDGFTIPIVWRTLRTEPYIITEEAVKEVLREFGVEEEEVSAQEVKQELKISHILDSIDHIEKACDYIAERIGEDTESFKFKAFVVANSRLACVRYKRILEEKLISKFGERAKNWVEVVMTYTDEEKVSEIRDFKEKVERRFGTSWQEVNRVLKEKFLTEENPKVLIVTDMLLTGFDAPMLKVMYVDKVMKDHQLLQAVARVNRPHEGKRYGIVVDIPGFLIENYLKAITQYNIYEDEEIKKDIAKFLFVEADKLWETFLERYKEFKKLFNSITDQEWEQFLERLNRGDTDKEEFDIIVSDIVLSPELEKFMITIKEALDLFNSLGAYPKKIEYYDKVGWILILKAYINRKRNPKKSHIPWDNIRKELIDKLSFDPFKETGKVSIDEETLKKLKNKRMTVILVADLLYTLLDEIENKKDLVYRELYNRLRELKESYLNNEISAEKLLKELIRIKKEKEVYERETRNLSKTDRIILNIRKMLLKRGYGNFSLERTNEILNKIAGRKVIPSSMWNELRKALHIDLINIKNTKQRDKLINKLVEDFIKPLMEG